MEYCKHEFVDCKKSGMSGGEYVVIYCKNCGVVSFDQARQGIDGDYQKLLTKPVFAPNT